MCALCRDFTPTRTRLINNFDIDVKKVQQFSIASTHWGSTSNPTRFFLILLVVCNRTKAKNVSNRRTISSNTLCYYYFFIRNDKMASSTRSFLIVSKIEFFVDVIRKGENTQASTKMVLQYLATMVGGPK